MKYFIHFCLLIIFSFQNLGENNLYAQSDLELEYASKLTSAKQDTAKVKILCEFSWELINQDMDMAESYLQEAMALANKTNFIPGKAEANKNLGVIDWYKSDYEGAKAHFIEALTHYQHLNDKTGIANTYNNLGLLSQATSNFYEAIEMLNKSLVIREEIKDSSGIATSCNNLGIIYEQTGDLNRALAYHTQALHIWEKTGDFKNSPFSYINIGSIYQATGDHEEALENFEKALTIHQEMKNVRGIGDAYGNIGEVYAEQNNFNKALHNFEEAFHISIELKDMLSQAETLVNIGKLYENKGDYLKAKENYLNSLNICREVNDKTGMVNVYNLLGNIHSSLGQSEKALTYLKKAADLGQEIGVLPSLQKTFGSITQVYRDKKDYKKAFEFQSKMVEVNHTLFTEEKSEALIELQTKYELDQKEKDIEYLNSDREMKESQYMAERQKNMLLLLGLSLLSTLALVLYASIRRKQKDNKLIELQNIELGNKNKELKELNEEKNTLLGIVAHDLKNPLSQIKGLVNIILTEPESLSPKQKMLTTKIGESSDNLTEMIRRILDVESIESSNLNLKLTETDLCTMVQQTLEEYQLDAKRKNIQVHFDSDKMSQLARVDQEYTHQVIGNLVSNALKYSPPQKRIFVHLQELDDKVQFRIKDEGPGLTESDQKKLFGRFQRLSAQPTGGEHSNGLGLSIVKKYVEAMNGKVWCESTTGHGATFVVDFEKVGAKSS